MLFILHILAGFLNWLWEDWSPWWKCFVVGVFLYVLGFFNSLHLTMDNNFYYTFYNNQNTKYSWTHNIFGMSFHFPFRVFWCPAFLCLSPVWLFPCSPTALAPFSSPVCDPGFCPPQLPSMHSFPIAISCLCCGIILRFGPLGLEKFDLMPGKQWEVMVLLADDSLFLSKAAAGKFSSLMRATLFFSPLFNFFFPQGNFEKGQAFHQTLRKFMKCPNSNSLAKPDSGAFTSILHEIWKAKRSPPATELQCIC